jgi:cytochrome bd-type quinol oxidase subunit 2
MSELNQQPAERSVKITHLVFGLLFLGVAVVWALVVGDVINENDLAVIAPAILIAAGVVGLATSLASARNRRNRNERPYDRPVDPHVDEPVDDQTDRPAESPLDDHTKEIR